MDEHGDWTQKNEVMDFIVDLLRYSYIGMYIALVSKSHSWVIPLLKVKPRKVPQVLVNLLGFMGG